jgi:hypothetical protein
VLTKPFATIDNQSDSDDNYKVPNILQQVLSLFKNVRLGSDLSRFKVSLHLTPKYIFLAIFTFILI